MTSFLFDMVKHGNIQPETIWNMHKAKFDNNNDKPRSKENYYI